MNSIRYGRKRNVKANKIGLLCFLIVSMMCLINYIGIRTDIICIILFFSLLAYMFAKKPETFIKYLYFVILSTWTVIAGYICENVAGLVIGNQESQYFGSLAPYTLSWVVFFLVLLSRGDNTGDGVIVSDNKNNKEDANKGIPQWIIIALIGLAIVNFLLVIKYPAFLLGVNRFYIRDNIQSKFSRNLYKYSISVIPILVFDRRNHKYAWLIFVAFLSLYNLWIGEKFGGFLMIIYYVVIGLLPDGTGYIKKAMNRNYKKIIVISLIAVIGLLGVVRFQRYVANPSENFSAYLSQRIASQAWVWWSTYGGDHDKGMHYDELGDELEVFFSDPETDWNNNNYGIYKLMKKFCNSQKTYYLLNARVRGAESGRASFYYYFKTPGLIIGQLLFAIIFSKVIESLLRAMKRRKVLLSFFYVQILRYLINAFVQSDFYLLTTLTAFVCYLGIFVLERNMINVPRIRGRNNKVLGRKENDVNILSEMGRAGEAVALPKVTE